MNKEDLTKIYIDLRNEVSQIENSLGKMEQRGKGIPFAEKNIRALKALIYAFKSGLWDPEQEDPQNS